MQIRWTKRANNNLQQIKQYIARDNPQAADNIVLRVIEAIEILATHPNAGRPERVPGTRELIVAGTPFLAPYRVKDGYVDVLRVLHCAMQWPAQF